jgi:hypothetical protein
MSKTSSSWSTGWCSARPSRTSMPSTAVRSWATDTGVKASSTRVIVAWSANRSRPHAAASAVSGRRRVLICLREAQSASIRTTTSSSFSWGLWSTVLQPSWTCSRRGAKKSRCCRRYPSAAKGAYCVCRFIAESPSCFLMLAYLRLEDLKSQVVCQFGTNFDSFDPPCFCAKFRCDKISLAGFAGNRWVSGRLQDHLRRFERLLVPSVPQALTEPDVSR